jgi:hypothetical protein
LPCLLIFGISLRNRNLWSRGGLSPKGQKARSQRKAHAAPTCLPSWSPVCRKDLMEFLREGGFFLKDSP